MTYAPMLSGSHWDALLDTLPTDPVEVTDDHVRLVLAALEGDERLLRAERADILFIASVTECREPVLLGRVVDFSSLIQRSRPPRALVSANSTATRRSSGMRGAGIGVRILHPRPGLMAGGVHPLLVGLADSERVQLSSGVGAAPWTATLPDTANGF